ncbi:MAG: hypothetical protein NC411_06490 [Bacteroides sp.]|nr:hypothetical protein [Bacteroides sp.]
MSISIESSIKCVGMPVIVSTSSPHLNFIVDTGANINSIFSFVYDGLPDYFTRLDTAKSVFGISGSRNSSIEVKAFIEFENTKAETVFSVIECNEVVRSLQEDFGFQLHGFIGSKFLKDNKWIIDFDKLEIITIRNHESRTDETGEI